MTLHVDQVRELHFLQVLLKSLMLRWLWGIPQKCPLLQLLLAQFRLLMCREHSGLEGSSVEPMVTQMANGGWKGKPGSPVGSSRISLKWLFSV